MADDRFKSCIGEFSSQQDAAFARRALVEIGRFDGNLISVVTHDDAGDTQAERYFVLMDDTSASVAQAKTFLKGSMPQMRVGDQDLRYDAKQSAERVKVTPFMGGMSL